MPENDIYIYSLDVHLRKETAMYQFTDDCRIGIDLIDNEHKKLFELINQTMEMMKKGEGSYAAAVNLLSELESYALTHFAHEEEYMEQINDNELERQRKEHDVFRKKIDSYHMEELSEKDGEKVMSELLQFMAKWLYHHILGSDILIGKFKAKPTEDIFAFTDEYKTGIRLVDDEHRKLFDIIRETNDVIKNDTLHDKYDAIMDILDELKEYTIKHFSDEEEYMKSINYDGLAAQHIAHTVFVDRLNEIDLQDVDDNQESYLNELIDFLLEWLINHIKNMDKRIPNVTI
jgi:hemerythrin